MTKIDAHQHFWSLERGDYGWLTPDLKEIYRDFGPTDLEPLMRGADIAGSVVVQAAPTVEETRYLLELADHESTIKGVVGWVDFESPSATQDIESLASDPKFLGVRPMIQDIEDDRWMLRPEFADIFAALEAHRLTFDALVYVRHLPILSDLLEQYPNLKVVIDHSAKPDIANKGFSSWAKAIKMVAENPNVYCKLSGLWTEADGKIALRDIQPYVSYLLTTFGPARLMWGSDWPVLTMAGEYSAWHAQCKALLFCLNADEQAAIFGGTAEAFYGFG